MMPAKILKSSEFCKNVCPKREAEAPRITNTVEKPKQNKISENIFILFKLMIS